MVFTISAFIVIVIITVGIAGIGYASSPTAHVNERVVLQINVIQRVCTDQLQTTTYTTYITANNAASPLHKNIVATQTTTQNINNFARGRPISPLK